MKNGTQSKIGPRMKKKMKKRKKSERQKESPKLSNWNKWFFFYIVKFDIYNEEGEILTQGSVIEIRKNVNWAIRLLTIG